MCLDSRRLLTFEFVLNLFGFKGENVANGTNSSRLRHCREDPRADKVDCNEFPNFFSSPVQLVIV